MTPLAVTADLTIVGGYLGLLFHLRIGAIGIFSNSSLRKNLLRQICAGQINRERRAFAANNSSFTHVTRNHRKGTKIRLTIPESALSEA